jgi:putative transcriptional regulator
MKSLAISEKNTNFESLAGKFLIASPHSASNDVFNKSLVYIASHTAQGAMGLIVNHLVNKLPATSVLKLFKDENNTSELVMPVYLGGPVEPERGFILHTAEYTKNLLLKAESGLAISSNIEILRDIAEGTGPKNSLFVLGYTGWTAGQLESELRKNMWIVSDSSNELIFSDNEDKWTAALSKLGIDNSTFSPYIGHC